MAKLYFELNLIRFLIKNSLFEKNLNKRSFLAVLHFQGYVNSGLLTQEALFSID